LSAQLQLPVQKQVQKQMLKLKHKFKYDFQFRPSFDFAYEPWEYDTTITKKLKFPFLDLPDNGKRIGRKEEPIDQGYGVSVKDRYIYSGKKTVERFTRMHPHPLTKRAAHSLGATIVDESAAASYRVFPIKGKPKKLKLPVTPFELIRGKFAYSPRQRAMTENVMYRIDSKGEVEQIPGRSVLKRMKQESRRKPRVKRTKKGISRVYSSEMIFDLRKFNKMIPQLRF